MKVVFICATQKTELASTALRAHQLCQIVSPALEAANYSAQCSTETEHRDSILILTKAALMETGARKIRAWQRHGNIVLADYLDQKIDHKKARAVDGFLASSHRQYEFLRKTYPKKICSLISHHVDLRIPAIRPPEDRPRIGYFGDLTNALFSEYLHDDVSFVETATIDSSSATWIERLKDFNCHYAVRARKEFDGFKPFTKGFIAAHCNSPILISAREDDAPYFLPSDYPLFLNADSADTIKSGIEKAIGVFASAEWRYAQEIMRAVAEQCSPNAISSAFVSLVREIRAPRRSFGWFSRPFIYG